MPGGSNVTETTFRDCLGRFATGVAVVTTRNAHGEPRAITVNAFSSVSVDPPLVLYCLGKDAFNFDTFSAASSFAVNILGNDQQALSNRFAAESADDMKGLDLQELATGSPVIADCVASIDCERHAIHDAGDHLIIVGRVAALETRQATSGDNVKPLIYFCGGYRALKS